MERWPNHQFSASSAQQYLWLEQLYPKGFERVKKHIKAGKFHYVGGAWLEHDCMMPSGESLVRQYLYGQRYFRSRFGEYCREAFLPDTFGYASQLPQILRQAGLNYFLTMKVGVALRLRKRLTADRLEQRHRFPIHVFQLGGARRHAGPSTPAKRAQLQLAVYLVSGSR
jgi:hypothetical protein